MMWYCVFMDGGVCLDYYLDMVVIVIDSLFVVGVLLQDIMVCYGLYVDFFLFGNVVDSMQWQVNVGLGWFDLVGVDFLMYQ